MLPQPKGEHIANPHLRRTLSRAEASRFGHFGRREQGGPRMVGHEAPVPRVVRRLVSIPALAFLLAAGSGVAVHADGRFALVIGNGAYSIFGELPNPRNDASDVGAAFERLRFDVTTVLDASRARMEEALQAFARRSVGADVALVFYAGHGMEMDGVNYLIPVDARLARDTDVEYETVQLDSVLRATQGAGLRVVILDACRNNPLARRMQRTRGATRSTARGGFGGLDEQRFLDETLVAYAAAAGTTAADGAGRNSPYTAALLEYLEAPIELSALFRRVRGRVLETTGGAQRPHEYQSLLGDHYLSDARRDLVLNVAPAYAPPGGAGAAAVGRSRPPGGRRPPVAPRAPIAQGLPAGLPPVSVAVAVSSTAELASGTGARLASEVRAILRARGLEVVEPVGGGIVPGLRVEGAVELSDAGDVAGTGFLSAHAVVSLQAMQTATGAVVAASRARSRGAGVSAADARDRAGIRAVEEAVADLLDQLVTAWSNR